MDTFSRFFFLKNTNGNVRLSLLSFLFFTLQEFFYPGHYNAAVMKYSSPTSQSFFYFNT